MCRSLHIPGHASKRWLTYLVLALATLGTRLGHLLLGSGFDARDLLAYALGIGAAAFVDRALVARQRGQSPAS
jgi:hypothetical protein